MGNEIVMQLWQMDVMSGVMLDDGSDLKLVTGVDDHSRFCIAAGPMQRATARTVCEVFNATAPSCHASGGA